MEHLLAQLNDEVSDVDEETFTLFSENTSSSQDLGMVDARADEVDVSVNGRDFTIKQSPGVLQSKREGGTTGAALWRLCVLVAEWLAWEQNPLFKYGALDTTATVVELGSGISGLVPLSLAPLVRRVVATDQQYALKLLQENVTNNLPLKKPSQKREKSDIDILPLDWEGDDIPSFLRSHDMKDGVDAVLVCDCVFNYALIRPLTQACADICKVRSSSDDAAVRARPTVCVIAQQLRQPDVFETWLRDFTASFHVWRIPDSLLISTLQTSTGNVLHLATLKEPETS